MIDARGSSSPASAARAIRLRGALVAIAVMGVAAGAARVSAQDDPAAAAPTCVSCHQRSVDTGAELPPDGLLKSSVHAGLDCADCHSSISMDGLDVSAPRPHGARSDRVNCGDCHDQEAAAYVKHGRLSVGEDPDLPTCADCHGRHDILRSDDRRSRVHPAGLPQTCRACHTNVDLVEKHPVLREAPIRLYGQSVHGRATRKGIYVAATCNDCHSSPDASGHRTAHRILGPADPESMIFHFRIPDTCGQCHEPIAKDYWEGIHGQLVRRGDVNAPVCTHCHGEHGIISPRDPMSPVSPARVAEQTCAPCHESAVLNAKYGLPGGRLASYVDSYHGLKSRAGDVRVANCASCHGAHRILPSADPTSSIHPTNLQNTCGECHPRISAELAQTKIHETGAGLYVGWPDFFRKFYIVLIVLTVGGMLLHNTGDWLRHVRRLVRLPYVQRFTTNEVLQHWVLMLSFTVLVITGFSLRFADAGWVKFLFGWEGGFRARGVIHRVSGVVLIIGAVWHAVYLLSQRGRHYFTDMMARWTDLTHMGQNVLYFLGRRERSPAFGRFSYMEKLEYWALVWGTVLMSATGVLLWFDNWFVAHWRLPKGLLDVALVIHYYEAWLATLAILVWHVYGTMFSPKVYPMNPAWISGRMPSDMYTHEHPAAPRLRTRVQRRGYEEELEENPKPHPGETVGPPAVRPETGDAIQETADAPQETPAPPAKPAPTNRQKVR
jgi:cytochrome b subunit of formate dehydrogenase